MEKQIRFYLQIHHEHSLYFDLLLNVFATHNNVATFKVNILIIIMFCNCITEIRTFSNIY